MIKDGSELTRLRDVFAAAALPAVMAAADSQIGSRNVPDTDTVFDHLAGVAYRAADAMLRARQPEREPKLTPEEHRQRHIELHQKLDELIADWIGHGKKLPSQATVMELMQWSHQQTLNPTEAR